MIVIIDYGMGNCGSVLNMLKRVGATALISSDLSIIEKAGKLILPGVGSFDNGIVNIKKLGLLPILFNKVLVEKTPLLGICLGMQLLTKSSEEGREKGLCLIDALTIKFKFEALSSGCPKVPHMGWNAVLPVRTCKLIPDLNTRLRYYFAHSYHIVCRDTADVAARTTHGYEFASAIEHDNISGVQFHPEKSHKFGIQLLSNFVNNWTAPL
jgi:glutamine amidotransferase